MGETTTSGQYTEVTVEVIEAGGEPELTPDRLAKSVKSETIYDGEKPDTIYDGEKAGGSPEVEREDEAGTGNTEKEETIYDG